MIYGYVRVSTDKQECSAEAQQADILRWAKDGCDRMFVDEDVSGGMPLQDRPQGKVMWDLLTPGDTVVVAKLDRAFRNLSDAANTHQNFKAQRIALVVLDLPIDINTPAGELFFHQLCAFAQFERRMIADRTRRACQHKLSTGKPYGRARPLGWVRREGQYVPCEEERETGRRLLAMRKAGLSYVSICWKFARERVRKPDPVKGSRGYYGPDDLRMLAQAAEAGYPAVPRAYVPALAREQMLLAETPHAPRRFDVASFPQ